MRLLLIEDDSLLGRGIVDAIEFDGEVIDWVKTGSDALKLLNTSAFDAAILDLGLPDMDGLEVLKQLRKKAVTVPVLILTARHQIDDRVRGLDMGADDYLVKPFDVNEFKARLRALIRRNVHSASPTLNYQAIEVDPASRQVTLAGEPIELARREYLLLLEFLSRPKRVFTRDELTEKIYCWDEYIGSNTIEVYIHHLRKKFGRNFIKTIRSVGYRLGAVKN
jgi:two-component system, OmpR family, response regulator QseB